MKNKQRFRFAVWSSGRAFTELSTTTRVLSIDCVVSWLCVRIRREEWNGNVCAGVDASRFGVQQRRRS